MPEIVYYVAASLDGYIATPDGGVEWLSPFEATSEDYGYGEFYASVDAVLMGSRTYEQVLTFGDWPYAGKPTWVLSQRPLEVQERGITVTDRTPHEAAGDLDRRGIRRAWLVGGGRLAGSFRTAGLITEYIVSLIPVILGEGVPLFGGPGPAQRLECVGCTGFASGVVQLRYRRPAASGAAG